MEFAERVGRPILRLPSQRERTVLEELVFEVATPRTQRALEEYQQRSEVYYLVAILFPQVL